MLFSTVFQSYQNDEWAIKDAVYNGTLLTGCKDSASCGSRTQYR